MKKKQCLGWKMQSRLKKHIRAEVIKIIWFRIKTIIDKKTETCTATLLKNWLLQNWMKNKKKIEKYTPPHFI